MLETDIICKKYKLIEKIGEGSFGIVYKSKNIRTNELVAIKVEKINKNTNILKYETKIMQYLNSFQKKDGIPLLYWFGKDEHNYYMSMQLLGMSIKENNNVQLKQILNRIEWLHLRGYIHRDIKPDNFLLDIENKNVYLIDFGFCKRYIINGSHIKKRDNNNKHIIGTPNFVSIRVYEGEDCSRRDDLESFVYIMLFLWKKNINVEDKYLLELNKIVVPKYIILCFEYCRQLDFEQDPNYEYLYSILDKY
jgi:serine/threonine protein kinase